MTKLVYKSYPSFDIEPTTGFPLPLFSVSWLPNGLVLLGGGGGNAKTGVLSGLIICRVEEGKLVPIGEINTGDNIVNSISMHPTLLEIACAIDCEQVLFHVNGNNNNKNNMSICTLKAQYRTCFEKASYAEQGCSLYNHKGTQIAAAGTDGIIRIYNRPDQLYKIIERKGSICDIDFSADDNVLVCVADNAECLMYNVQTGDLLRTLTYKHKDKNVKFARARFMKYKGTEILITCVNTYNGHESYLLGWDPESWTVARKIFISYGPLVDVSIYKHTNDHIVCLSVDRNTECNHINIYNINKWSRINHINVRDKMATAISFSPNMQSIVYVAPNYAEIVSTTLKQRSGCCTNCTLFLLNIIIIIASMYAYTVIYSS